jgi:histidine triad (HIT) family protein
MNTSMMNCPFCKILKDEIPTHKIYEDEYVLAFLDKHPINPGHVLVIPKKHEADFYKLDDNLYYKLMFAVKKLADVVNNFTHPKKVGLIIAGWDVQHTHVHIVPMHDYHDITSKSMLEGKRSNPSDEELKKITEGLKELISAIS